MARRLFYVDEVRAGRARLEGPAAEHLRRVLRAQRGFVYELSDGAALYLAEVEDFTGSAVVFRLLEELPVAPPAVEIHLFPALVKFDAFEWMLEKATELGVSRITPVYSLRCDKGLDQAAGKRMDRWRRILIESGQQSRRLAPPALAPLAEFSVALAEPGPVRLFFDEAREAPPLPALLPPAASASRLAALIGPEGGWDDRERAAAATSGWTAASLGPNILRAETAALAALAVLQSHWQTTR